MAGLFWVIAVLGGLWILLACSSSQKIKHRSLANRVNWNFFVMWQTCHVG
jgi:hypothetical protein